MKLTDKARLDWLEKESKERVISFHHPKAGFAHVRAAIDVEVLKAQASAKPKPTRKTK